MQVNYINGLNLITPPPDLLPQGEEGLFDQASIAFVKYAAYTNDLSKGNLLYSSYPIMESENVNDRLNGDLQ